MRSTSSSEGFRTTEQSDRRIGVVVLNYNGGDDTVRCIDSLCSQVRLGIDTIAGRQRATSGVAFAAAGWTEVA